VNRSPQLEWRIGVEAAASHGYRAIDVKSGRALLDDAIVQSDLGRAVCNVAGKRIDVNTSRLRRGRLRLRGALPEMQK